jgi:hydrogenase small subunit
MNQPPGSKLSSVSIFTYGKAIRALRRFTQGSLNQEPDWRKPGPELKSGYKPPNGGPA